MSSPDRNAERKSLPPGTSGLPLLGETLSFLKNPYAFVSDRVKKHGPIFRTSLLGKDTAVIVGAEAAAAFIDGARVLREGSQPDNIYRLFAGPSLPHLDGAAHRERKALVLAAFSQTALEHYLPAIEARSRRSLASWTAQDEVPLLDALKRISVEAVAEDMMGITDVARIESLLRYYEATGAAFTSLPVAFPGTAYARGLKAVDAILAVFDEIIGEHRARPSSDGLSRVLAFTTPEGTKITDDQAKRELHHLIIAGRVVYAHLGGMVVHLAAHPEIRKRAAEEVARVAPSGALTLPILGQLSYLTQVLLEVKRTSPVVPGMFAIAKEDIELYGHVIPKGWKIMFGLYQSHQLEDAYPEPGRFDPERFGPERREDARSEHAFCPHGPGAPRTSHHCAGTDYATELVMVFTTLLLRDHTWELPEQNLDFDWSNLTPDPRGGLRVRIRNVHSAGTRGVK